MPLSEDDYLSDQFTGRIAASFTNLEVVQDRVEEFLRRVLPLCREGLKGEFGEDVKKTNEKLLSSALCKELSAYAFEEGVVFGFSNEDPSRTKKTRTHDITTNPAFGRQFIEVGPQYYSIHHTFYVIEAKRLPSPKGGVVQGDRSREYVVVDWANRTSPSQSITGGIERFKEGKHAPEFCRAGMIAFIQKKTPSHWLNEINGWICELIAGPKFPKRDAPWGSKESLHPVANVPNSDEYAE